MEEVEEQGEVEEALPKGVSPRSGVAPPAGGGMRVRTPPVGGTKGKTWKRALQKSQVFYDMMWAYKNATLKGADGKLVEATSAKRAFCLRMARKDPERFFAKLVTYDHKEEARKEKRGVKEVDGLLQVSDTAVLKKEFEEMAKEICPTCGRPKYMA